VEPMYYNYSPPPAAKPRRSRIRTLLVLTTAFILGGLLLPNLHISWRGPNGNAEPGATLGVVPGPPPQGLAESESYARAAQTASPAVVNIDTQQRVQPNFMQDPFWMGGPQVQTTEGSGVIIDKSGDILTNEHVVGSANEAGKKIKVTLNDKEGRTFTGTVIGADHQTDVALVHIDAPPDLPVAKMGTVKGLIPGQMAVAIGNPLGFRFTVTHGVVSALGRPINDDAEGRIYENLIQTDCAINPGNSGGALCNIQGQVIGINTIVASRAQGIGFAIPIDTALRVADELKRFGRIKRPWTGIVVVTNTPQLAAANELPNVPGVVIARIYRSGPAAQAGLHAGDVITKLGGEAVRTEEDFKAREKRFRIGEQIDIEIQRGDTKGHGSLVVGEAP
jgi:serine protease Do